jgi:hypothetical protein
MSVLLGNGYRQRFSKADKLVIDLASPKEALDAPLLLAFGPAPIREVVESNLSPIILCAMTP